MGVVCRLGCVVRVKGVDFTGQRVTRGVWCDELINGCLCEVGKGSLNDNYGD